MNQLQITVEELRSLSPTDVIRNEKVKSKFIEIYDAVWGGGGESAYASQSNFFIAQIKEKAEDMKACGSLSIFTAFISLAVNGLSIEITSKPQCYLQKQNYKIGIDARNQPIYEPRAVVKVSAYGELFLRVRAGQIRHADNPVIVYEGDEFSFSDNGGQKIVNYTRKLPRQSDKIVACFMKITRNDGTIDYSVMFEEDWIRLQGYSMKLTRSSNALYTSNNGQIDTGFLIAKCVRHAFNTYPKVRIGKAAVLETESEDDIDYGVNEEGLRPQSPKPFEGENNDAQAPGVVIEEPEDEDDGAF